MICSSKHLCINPNQGNLIKEDFYKYKKQCKLCINKKIHPPVFDYKECSNVNCINPKQGNLKKEDFGPYHECKMCFNFKRKLYRNSEHGKKIIQNFINSGQKFNNHLKRTYGITLEEYNKMLKNQNYKCLIEGCNENIRESAEVDHDHKTGKVRGLLCYNCNKGLGNFKDDINKLKGAIKYLEKF